MSKTKKLLIYVVVNQTFIQDQINVCFVLNPEAHLIFCFSHIEAQQGQQRNQGNSGTGSGGGSGQNWSKQ